MNCKHGIEKEWCGLCNGSVDKQEAEFRSFKVKKAEKAKWNTKRKALQKESIAFATNHKEPFSDDELKMIVNSTTNVEKENIEVLFEIAFNLKRRLGAIEWVWNVAWDDEYTEYDKEATKKNLWKRVKAIKNIK